MSTTVPARLTVQVDLPPTWAPSALEDLADRLDDPGQPGSAPAGTAPPAAVRTLARALTAARDHGLVYLATTREDVDGPAGPVPLIAGLAISVRRLSPDRPEPDELMLRTALRAADRRQATLLRPLELPHMVELPLGPAIRRGAVRRVPGTAMDRAVVLEDRVMCATHGVLLVADFLSPNLALQRQLRGVFARIAETIRVHVDG